MNHTDRTHRCRVLVDTSLSPNTRRAYAGALGQLDAWLAGRRLDDAALAAYLDADMWACDAANWHSPRPVLFKPVLRLSSNGGGQ